MSLPATMHDILAIDDCPDDLLLYARFLERGTPPRRVTGHVDAREAIEALKTQSFDCVLLDYLLGAEDGLAVLHQLREVDPLCPVVMLTGNGSETVATEALKNGALDYVPKDRLSPTVLNRAVSNAIERARLERQLHEQQAEQSQFLRTLVHDIKAPLRNVGFLADMAVTDFADELPEVATETLDMMRLEVDRIRDFVDTLAAYAFLDGEVAFESVNLTETVRETLSSVGETLQESGARVTFDSLPMVQGHKPQLRQLLQNLILNGVKFNRSKTPEVHIGVEPRSGLVFVRDNGIGVPKAAVQKIFDPFLRLNHQDEFTGTGLGLATVRKIMQRHGGRVWCESGSEEGSSFYLEFPPMAALDFCQQKTA